MKTLALLALLCSSCATVVVHSEYDAETHRELCTVLAVAAGQSQVVVDWRPAPSGPQSPQINVGVLAATQTPVVPAHCLEANGGLASAGFWSTLVTLGVALAPFIGALF